MRCLPLSGAYSPFLGGYTGIPFGNLSHRLDLALQGRLDAVQEPSPKREDGDDNAGEEVELEH